MARIFVVLILKAENMDIHTYIQLLLNEGEDILK